MPEKPKFLPWRQHPPSLLLLLLAFLATSQSFITQVKTESEEASNLLWPNKQLNVLIDVRSLNESEQQIIASGLDQIEHKTCVSVNRLEPNRVNPFDTSGSQLGEGEKNFIYIFKSHVGLYNKPPTNGLSTLGCAKRGRQSVVLTESAFRWPEIVLRYHLMRSLGVQNLKKPSDAELLQSPQLPLSQKIIVVKNGSKQKLSSSSSASNETMSSPERWPLAFAAGPQATASTGQIATTKKMLSDSDLAAIKQLYDCSDYQNRLSVKPPLLAAQQQQSNSTDGDRSTLAEAEDRKQPAAAEAQTGGAESGGSRLTKKKLKNAEESLKQIIQSVVQEKGAQIDEELVDNAAKSIVHYLLAELEGEPMGGSNASDAATAIKKDGAQLESLLDSLDASEAEKPSSNEQPDCSSKEPFDRDSSCRPQVHDGSSSSSSSKSHQERSTDGGRKPSVLEPGGEQERPMLLKLDQYHANDPQLKQANQMKLSQMNGSSSDNSDGQLTPQTYRLLNQSPAQQRQQLDPPLFDGPKQTGKSEMMISFEQTPDKAKTGIDALASSQVLKLCSCTCQTMTPAGPFGGPSTSSKPPASSLPPTMKPPAPSTDMPTMPPLPTLPALPTLPTFPTFPTFPTNDDDYSPKTPSAPPRPSTLPMTSPSPPWTLTEYPSMPTGTPPWPSIDPSWTEWPSEEPTPRPPSTTTKKPSTTTTQKPSTSTTKATTTTPKGTDGFTYAPTLKPPPTWPLPPPSTSTTHVPPVTTDETWAPPTTSPAADGEDLPTATPSGTATTNSSLDFVGAAACDQVQWVKPNKTIYSSAKIVWDVDRANQNYFLCNAQLDGELVPGKTHGLSCKVSSEGKAYELHQFQVLIKPESVNLAWVQKDSKSFGTKNLPVIGGYSKSSSSSSLAGMDGGGGKGDPYVVSRCLVRDENNDVITLIGYINRQNVGWFPFDDIQIECSQYDVLACVN